MTATIETAAPSAMGRAEKACALALRLAHAEHALLSLTAGQVDAIVDPTGKTFLLRPAQEALRQSERRLRAVLEGAVDVITVVNRAGAILSQNAATSRVLGYEPDELVGRSLFDVIHEEDGPAVHFAFLTVAEGLAESAATRFRHRDPDGAFRMIEATVGKLGGETSGSVVFSMRSSTFPLRDHPEVPRHETAGAQDSLTKDRFLAMLSHELRTPLTPALLGIQELQEDGRFAEAGPELTVIRRNLELQSHLLVELSDFTSVGQQKLRLRREPINAHEAIRAVLQICQSEISAARITVLLNLEAPRPMVLGDPVRLQQVMWNLVKNSVKFSAPGGTISIATENDPPGRLTIEFADHGIGIEPELLPLLFAPFQQGDHAMQKRYGGLGLGMFIAKEMTEAQGGTLTAASAGRGTGATFCLALHTAPDPSSTASFVPVEEPAAPLPPIEPLSILLVKGSSNPQLTEFLEASGHTVFAAQNLLAGRSLAENCRFDLVMSDVSLPDGSGYELMEHLQRTRPHLPGISLSGRGVAADRAHSREAGFSEHLGEPITREDLQSVIKAVAAKSSA